MVVYEMSDIDIKNHLKRKIKNPHIRLSVIDFLENNEENCAALGLYNIMSYDSIIFTSWPGSEFSLNTGHFNVLGFKIQTLHTGRKVLGIDIEDTSYLTDKASDELSEFIHDKASQMEVEIVIDNLIDQIFDPILAKAPKYYEWCEIELRYILDKGIISLCRLVCPDED